MRSPWYKNIKYVDFKRQRKLFRREYKNSLDCKSETNQSLTNERRVSESLTNEETLSGSCHAQLVTEHLESLAQGRRSRSGAVRRAEHHARCRLSINRAEYCYKLYCQSEWPGPQTCDTLQGDSRGRCEQKGWIRYIYPCLCLETRHLIILPVLWDDLPIISRVIKLITLQVADLRMTPLSGRDYDSHRALTLRGQARWDTNTNWGGRFTP